MVMPCNNLKLLFVSVDLIEVEIGLRVEIYAPASQQLQVVDGASMQVSEWITNGMHSSVPHILRCIELTSFIWTPAN